MSQAPAENLQTLLSKIRAFISEEAIPLEREFLRRPIRELLPALEEKRRRVKSLGLWSAQLPREYGGLGLTLTEFARVSEELGRTPLGHYLFNCQAPDAGNMEALMLHATPEQKELYLWPVVRGEARSCFSMTEPEHPGSNPVWMSTTAVKDGDDYVVNGHKWFTSSAEGAAFAIVMAVTKVPPLGKSTLTVLPSSSFRLWIDFEAMTCTSSL